MMQISANNFFIRNSFASKEKKKARSAVKFYHTQKRFTTFSQILGIVTKSNYFCGQKIHFFYKMKHSVTIESLASIDQAAKEFLEQIGDATLVAFYAPMGAGKTTFTTALCRQLGVREDAVSSPTFAIVNEYRTAAGKQVYHFDFYRIERPEEALDIGLYDYLDSGNLCLMEWPENIESLLPEETLKVKIEVSADGSRLVTWED